MIEEEKESMLHVRNGGKNLMFKKQKKVEDTIDSLTHKSLKLEFARIHHEVQEERKIAKAWKSLEIQKHQKNELKFYGGN